MAVYDDIIKEVLDFFAIVFPGCSNRRSRDIIIDRVWICKDSGANFYLLKHLPCLQVTEFP